MKRTTDILGRLTAAAALVVTLGLAPAAMANEVVALKNALYGAGYDITNVSPQMDDTTRAALNRFQQENGLQVTGTLDKPTKKALGMVSVQVIAAAPAQSAPSASAAESSPVAQTVSQQQAEQGNAVEEDEKGGWSLW